jgi:hypothetical protein
LQRAARESTAGVPSKGRQRHELQRSERMT